MSSYFAGGGEFCLPEIHIFQTWDDMYLRCKLGSNAWHDTKEHPGMDSKYSPQITQVQTVEYNLWYNV